MGWNLPTAVPSKLTCMVLHLLCSRETKLVEKASKHVQNTAQRFDDENALMSSCFFNLEDDIFEYERHAVRMHLIRNAASINAVATLNGVSEAERSVRASEDVEVLDTVIETQNLLQQTVSTMFVLLKFMIIKYGRLYYRMS